MNDSRSGPASVAEKQHFCDGRHSARERACLGSSTWRAIVPRRSKTREMTMSSLGSRTRSMRGLGILAAASIACVASLPHATTAHAKTVRQCESGYSRCEARCQSVFVTRARIDACSNRCISTLSVCFGRASDRLPAKAPQSPPKNGPRVPVSTPPGGVVQPPPVVRQTGTHQPVAHQPVAQQPARSSAPARRR